MTDPTNHLSRNRDQRWGHQGGTCLVRSPSITGSKKIFVNIISAETSASLDCRGKTQDEMKETGCREGGLPSLQAARGPGAGPPWAQRQRLMAAAWAQGKDQARRQEPAESWGPIPLTALGRSSLQASCNQLLYSSFSRLSLNHSSLSGTLCSN